MKLQKNVFNTIFKKLFFNKTFKNNFLIKFKKDFFNEI